MLDKHLVTHCSPTLAGLKSANIFNYSFTSINKLTSQLNLWNEQFASKGVSVRVLRFSKCSALIYVYRKQKVQEELKRQGVLNFLSNYGYETDQLEFCLQFLSKRFSSHSGFPHEVGLFLGYPLQDVVGFVKNQGKNFHCSGCWKVYCNQWEAQKVFAKFEKCKSIYIKLFNKGKSIVQLTVAA